MKWFVLGFLARIAKDVVKIAFRDYWDAVFIWRLWPKCEHCGTIRQLKFEDSRTLYYYKGNDDVFSGKPDPHDPNRPQLLCRKCAVLHHDYWDDMWKDYYSGRL